ncbi:hypothetical protein PGB90_000060 [Kerria lacca]
MPLCSPSLSLCGIIISIWGIIQLVLMGFFYKIHSLALSEDLPGLDEGFTNVNEFYAKANSGYSQNAFNCWIAACLYVITLFFSAHQFYLNSRNSISM